MENAPVMYIGSRRAHPEYEKRFYMWVSEAYHPLLAEIPGIVKYDRYEVLGESPDFPKFASFQYFENINAYERYLKHPIAVDFFKDQNTLWADRTELILAPLYRLIRNFRPSPVSGVPNTAEAPLMHVEGYSLTPEGKEKYFRWFTKWGYEVYMPLLMKVPGLKEYDLYEFIRVASHYAFKAKVEDYPAYLSILHFESLKAFEEHQKSPELAAFRQSIKSEFYTNPEYQWYKQYKLLRSYKK